MLLFPCKKTHKLEKPYKNEINIENNPLGDAEQTSILFEFLDEKFDELDLNQKEIFIFILFENEYFKDYFSYKNIHKRTEFSLYERIKDKIYISQDRLESLLKAHPLELAFVLAFIFERDERGTKNARSISSVILKRHPQIAQILKELTGQDYNEKLLLDFAENEFEIKEFREFDRDKSESLFDEGSQISQQEIVLSALENKSFLAILPTGGGKTFTFQLPALIRAKEYKGLNIVISPLQALMKNHVDNFKDKNQNFIVSALSGYLSPIERMNVLQELEDGITDILYLAPEALRSKSVFSALQKRMIERFIIDEAHCFSMWGHDFRHDYYFINKVIQKLEQSTHQDKIQVSCFTATAKMEVMKDIKNYFKTNLGLDLKEFIASSTRENLIYEVIEVSSEKEKYEALLEILRQIYHQKLENPAFKYPIIIYNPQNARLCKKLSDKLKIEGKISDLELKIEPFYAALDEDIKQGQRKGRNKSEILKDFIDNKIDIVIATTAFGMGIDKPDIKAVIHYTQSDSLESYMQESGRGARQKELEARCILLYQQDEFNAHFARIINAKLSLKEIQNIAGALKSKKFLRKDENGNFYVLMTLSQIAEEAGIDYSDSKIDYKVLIKTVLLELEKHKLINMDFSATRVFATSINSKLKNKEQMVMEYVREKLESHNSLLSIKQYPNMNEYIIRITQNLIGKSKQEQIIEVGELFDLAGVDKKLIFEILFQLRKLQFIADENDIVIFIKKEAQKRLEEHFKKENIIQEALLKNEVTKSMDIKTIEFDFTDKKVNKVKEIKQILKSFRILSDLNKKIFSVSFRKSFCYFEIKDKAMFLSLIQIRQKICKFIIEYLLDEKIDKQGTELEISSVKLKQESEYVEKISLAGFHHCLVYLNETLKKVFELRKGRLIYYEQYKIFLSQNFINTKINSLYKTEDYKQSLDIYYMNKIKSMHILIKFLDILKNSFNRAKNFIKDYFNKEEKEFLRLYHFDKALIELPIIEKKRQEIMYSLDEQQEKIVKDRESQSILILAGPGSGKTKTLVSKIASLVTIENNKAEYFLMLAHSKVAVNEFKERLQKLIGNYIYDMKIFTFHAFALELLGQRIKEQAELTNIIQAACKLLKEGDLTLPNIQMLVLDEYQDVSAQTYEFIKTIYEKAKQPKIIAVGDDDQCINHFGNERADIKYICSFMQDFIHTQEDEEGKEGQAGNLVNAKNEKSKIYSLSTNYRSAKELVVFTNEFRKKFLAQSLKQEDLKANDKNKQEGFISLTHYKQGSFMKNLITQIKEDKSEQVAVLLRSNDEVLSLYQGLLQEGIKSRYITSKDDFSLKDLMELDDFYQMLLKTKDYDKTRQEIGHKYRNSLNFRLLNEILNKFENMTKAEDLKYADALFGEFLQELSFNEFESLNSKVIVSTMHKAKGKEFQSVYVGIDEKFDFNDIYEKRLLYVAFTRAKSHLHIHSRKDVFSQFYTYVDKKEYDKIDEEPDKICFIMDLADVYLSNQSASNNIRYHQIMAGDICQIRPENNNFSIYKNNVEIARLSKPTSKKSNGEDRLSLKILNKLKQNYILDSEVNIEYIINYKDKENKSFLVPLCRITMSKNKTDDISV